MGLEKELAAIKDVNFNCGLLSGLKYAGFDDKGAIERVVEHLKKVTGGHKLNLIKDNIENQADVLNYALKEDNEYLPKEVRKNYRLLKNVYRQFLEQL